MSIEINRYLKEINPIVNFTHDDLYSLPKIIATAFFKERIQTGECIYNFDHRDKLKNISHEEFLKKLINDKEYFKACEISDLSKSVVTPVELYCNE